MRYDVYKLFFKKQGWGIKGFRINPMTKITGLWTSIDHEEVKKKVWLEFGKSSYARTHRSTDGQADITNSRVAFGNFISAGTNITSLLHFRNIFPKKKYNKNIHVGCPITIFNSIVWYHEMNFMLQLWTWYLKI